MLGADYSDLDSVVAEWTQNLQNVDLALRDELLGASEDGINAYVAWKANADYFISLASVATRDAETWALWKKTGLNILQHGRDLAQLIESTTLVGQINTFISTFPASLSYVVNKVLQTAGNAAANAAKNLIPWYVWAGAIGLGGLVLWGKTRKTG
jgi:hypothetical protein